MNNLIKALTPKGKKSKKKEMSKTMQKAMILLQESSPEKHALLRDLVSEELGQAHLLNAFDGIVDDDETFSKKLNQMMDQLQEFSNK